MLPDVHLFTNKTELSKNNFTGDENENKHKKLFLPADGLSYEFCGVY